MRAGAIPCWLVVACLAGTCGGTASAGALSVSPTRVELSRHHPVATLEVRNEGADPVTVQLERLAWTQTAGVDAYAPSAELIATPTVFALAPRHSQILRLALRDGAATQIERAYRLYVAEVPTVSETTDSGLKMALRIGVPVFIEATDADARLDGRILAQPEGGLAVQLRNVGGHFTRVLRVELRDSTGTVVWESGTPAYLLSGGEHFWPIDSTLAKWVEQLRVSALTETGVVNIDSRVGRPGY